MDKIPSMMESLIVKRNRNWLPKLKALLTKEKAFVAVGVGHLIGPTGLIDQLRKQGFKIKRIFHLTTASQKRER